MRWFSPTNQAKSAQENVSSCESRSGDCVRTKFYDPPNQFPEDRRVRSGAGSHDWQAADRPDGLTRVLCCPDLTQSNAALTAIALDRPVPSRCTPSRRGHRIKKKKEKKKHKISMYYSYSPEPLLEYIEDAGGCKSVRWCCSGVSVAKIYTCMCLSNRDPRRPHPLQNGIVKDWLKLPFLSAFPLMIHSVKKTSLIHFLCSKRSASSLFPSQWVPSCSW